MKKFLKSFIVSVFIGTFLINTTATAQQYDVAAYVWPSYQRDDRAKIFWPEGIGEWETVASNKPKFEGHEQPRYPLWGYINEADPYVAEMEINAASEHGVNVFIFDWYWYDGLPFLEDHLNNGFLKAKNNHKMKFYIMWANHDLNMVCDKRNAGKKNNSILWRGAVDREEFEIVGRRMIDKYFSHPSYYKVDGKPSFMIYYLSAFVQGLGGIEETKDALEWFRQETIKAGFPGLDLQLNVRWDNTPVYAKNGKTIGTETELCHQLGFSAATHYQFAAMVKDIDRDYLDILKDVEKVWEDTDQSYKVPYYPHVSVGWDANPRFEMFIPGIIKNNTPENFKKALEKAKAYVDAHPKQAPLITINSWNEWTETSYLQPCTMYGYGYLEAIKAVFMKKK